MHFILFQCLFSNAFHVCGLMFGDLIKLAFGCFFGRQNINYGRYFNQKLTYMTVVMSIFEKI